jgi:xylulokinase
MATLTVGIDIGTTSVKALAVAEDGEVVASSRVPHRIIHSSGDHMEHDAAAAWRRGPRRAIAVLREAMATPTDRPGAAEPHRIAGICVSGMVPSLTAVDRRGIPRTSGLLYGDLRGRSSEPSNLDPSQAGSMPDAEGFLQWTAGVAPEAFGYWPAQAVATYALAGHPAIDTSVASTLGELHVRGRWNEDLMTRLGVDLDQLPDVVLTGQPAGTLPRPRRGAVVTPGWDDTDAVVAGGSIDAFCDQIVAGASQAGDVHVIFGATLIVWVVTDAWVEAPGLWSVPHTAPGQVLIGGPSNAGALFVDWARSLTRPAPATGAADDGRIGDPRRVPVWLPYLRGERVPFHDPSLRAGLFDLDITDTPAGLSRAAYEASGFVVRSIIERSGVAARRVVASGGGTHVKAWMAAMADTTGLPVDTVAVPDGAALGAAYLARMAAGLESSLDGSMRWARTGGRIEPDPAWQEAADRRFQRFVGLGSGR